MDRRTFIKASSIGAALSLTSQSSLAQEPDELIEQYLEETQSSDFFSSASDVVSAPFVGGDYFSGGNRPFAIYQMRESARNRYEIVDPANVEPAIAGSTQMPDVGIQISMAGAHFAESVWADAGSKTRATMRVTSKGDAVNNADTLHWALTAGLNLYEAYKGDGKITNPIEIGTRLTNTGQSLQFKEGAGSLQISVLGHKKPSWWDNVFSFLRGSGGEALIGALGFPAITVSALKFVDELTNRIADSGRKPIFQASFANVAFSERGVATSNNPAVLNGGLWLIVNPTDKEKFEQFDAYYYGGFARMIPGAYDEPSDVLVGDDPFDDVTYAVLRADVAGGKFL